MFAMGPVQFSWPRGVAEICLLNRDLGSILSIFPRRKQQRLTKFLRFRRGRFAKSDFSGLAPIRWLLILYLQNVTPQVMLGTNNCRDQQLKTNLFFSLTFRAPPGYPGKNHGTSGPRVWFPGFQETYRTFWPSPVLMEDPHHTRRYPYSRVLVCALFFSWDVARQNVMF